METKRFKLEVSRAYIKKTLKMYAKYVSKKSLKTPKDIRSQF
jgi:hypothetical protein